jgi:hypothetical protein
MWVVVAVAIANKQEWGDPAHAGWAGAAKSANWAQLRALLYSAEHADQLYTWESATRSASLVDIREYVRSRWLPSPKRVSGRSATGQPAHSIPRIVSLPVSRLWEAGGGVLRGCPNWPRYVVSLCPILGLFLSTVIFLSSSRIYCPILTDWRRSPRVQRQWCYLHVWFPQATHLNTPISHTDLTQTPFIFPAWSIARRSSNVLYS